MLLDTVKTRLRISTTDFDADLSALISEAKADLVAHEILLYKISDTNPDFIRVIVSYCRGYFDVNAADTQEWRAVYEKQRNELTMDGRYNGAGI